MEKYFCKYGGTFKKSGSSDTTGYRLQDFGPGHECFGCPFVLEVKEWYPKPIVKGFECRGSKQIRYDSTARLSVKDKSVGKIYSLDLAFLKMVKEFANSIDGIVPDQSAFSSRPADYGEDGRHILSIYPLQNKAGIHAKQLLKERFFNVDGSRKDKTPDEEKAIVLNAIRICKLEAKAVNTYFAPCGHEFKRARNGAQQTTVEVTGAAFSLNCFSCPQGRTESGDGRQGPKVFCVCTRSISSNNLENEEVNKMGKLNLANISAGLNQVKSVAESLANVSHHELIPLEYIQPAEHNSYAENDTDESRYEVAMSIQANGLLEPLVVNKKADDKFTLISGEHRFTAIKQYLPNQFKKVSCMVFEGLTDDEAQLKLHEANRQRQYTPEEKFKHYLELDELLHKMKDSGNYHGPIQKGIADLLGVSTRQIRKYQTVMQLAPEIQQAVIQGNLSINEACETQSSQLDTVPPKSDESGTSSAFGADEQEEPHIQNNNTLPRQQEEDRSPALPQNIIKSALKQHYFGKEARLFLFYLFQVPTTQEALPELKPEGGYSGGTVQFEDGSWGDCTARSTHIEISFKRSKATLTYSQVDSIIREMIRSGEWISQVQEKEQILKHIGKGVYSK